MHQHNGMPGYTYRNRQGLLYILMANQLDITIFIVMNLKTKTQQGLAPMDVATTTTAR